MAIPRNLANIAPAMNGSEGKVTIGGSTPLGTFNLVGLTRPSGVVTYTSAEASAKAQAGLNWYEDNNANFEYYLDIFATSTNESPWAGSNIRMLTTPVGTTTAVERARITRDGNFLVGTTSSSLASATTGTGVNYLPNNALIVAANGGNNCFIANKTNSTTGSTIDFRYNGSSVGNVSITSSSTSYNTSSDYRLKNTIAPMTGALNKIAQLKPVTYKWNVDGSDGEGFIAHELAEVVPACVSGEKDAIETYVDENGIEQTRPKYQGIDTSFLVATLTAAIQEQQTIIESLKARLDAANL